MGLCAGRSTSSTPSFEKHFFMGFTLCMLALSCWNRKSLPESWKHIIVLNIIVCSSIEILLNWSFRAKQPQTKKCHIMSILYSKGANVNGSSLSYCTKREFGQMWFKIQIQRVRTEWGIGEDKHASVVSLINRREARCRSEVWFGKKTLLISCEKMSSWKHIYIHLQYNIDRVYITDN